MRILVDLPAPLVRAARMAIDETNAAHLGEFENVTLKEVVLDDTVDGTVDIGAAKQRVRQQLNDSTVLGMVGPASLPLARAELPLASNSDLAIVSPNLTEDCLTQTRSYCSRGEPNSLRPHNAKPHAAGDLTFFRIPATNDTQGGAAADFLDAQAKKSAFVITDQTTSGQALAAAFKSRWDIKGGLLTGSRQLDFSQGADLGGLAAEIRALRPDALYFASNNAARFAQIVRDLSGAPITLLGTDASFNEAFLQAVGTTKADVAVSSLASDPSSRARRFLAAYRARYPQDQAPAPFTLETYDATRSLIEAIRLAILALNAQDSVGIPKRDAVQQLMSSVSASTEDLTGISYDTSGDNTSHLLTYYRLTNGKWAFDQQAVFAG
jgi:branched-chain amino acid transport system substrate-binding protein